MDMIKKYVPVDKSKEAEVMEKVAAPLKSEGGANVKLGDRNVSFVAADLYSSVVSGPMTDDEVKGAESYAGEKFGEMILHELGHGMNADHDHGIMEAHPEFVVNPDAPSPQQNFTTTSKKSILATLERLASSAK